MVIIILLIVIYFQYQEKKDRNSTIRYTYEKLQSIITEQTGEKILAATTDPELQQLLVRLMGCLIRTKRGWLPIEKWKFR